MSFLDINDSAERATLVKEYVTAMKTVKQRNMTNREMKLAIGDELQTLFHPIGNATKQAAEETRKEFALMKKTLKDIDGALTAQREHATVAKPQPSNNIDTTFGIYRRQDGQLGMGSKVVQVDGEILTVDDTEYNLAPGLRVLVSSKHLRPGQWKTDDYQVYKSPVAQTKVRSNPYKPDDTDSVEYESIGDIDRTAPGILIPEYYMSSQSPMPLPVHTRSYGKAKKEKDRKTPCKGDGVVYLPGVINGLTKKLYLLAAEFLAGNTTGRNELVHVLDALLRLKQLTRKEYTDITAHLAASL